MRVAEPNLEQVLLLLRWVAEYPNLLLLQYREPAIREVLWVLRARTYPLSFVQLDTRRTRSSLSPRLDGS